MSKMNFSVSKNKEIVADELEDDEDEDYSSSSSSSSGNDNEERKKLIKLLVIAILVIVGGILLITFVTSLGGGSKTYEEIEVIMSNAAEAYFTNHPESLPQRDGGSQTVDVSVLVAEGHMKDLVKYTDSLCTGTVKVQKAGTSYIYIPYLNCGESYSTEELYDVVKNDNTIVSSGYGLYSKEGNFVFRGEQVNNYVKLDNALWRIVKLNGSRQIVLVMDKPLSVPVPWDDRYNETANYNAGINNYETSRIKETLNTMYNSVDESVTKTLLSDKDKTRIVAHNSCTGKRGLKQAGAEQAIECQNVSRDQKISLLTAADFINASVDANCTNPSSLTCQNYNYLVNDSSWWVSTAVTNTTSKVYLVGANSGLEAKDAMMYGKIRPVVYLSSETMYKSGSGTEADPYIVK